ncbi:MAG: 4Fe-4S dicluster domain-containing protein [Proteobacteria bacterium]|nr:4Fe-4S dicluster domain-containing protein [Pseudomonadota bacterium]
MIQRHLRSIRIVISLFFLLLIAGIFLDFYDLIQPDFIPVILFFQVMPALMKTLSTGGMALFSLLAVLGLTVLAGRLYCSFLCPLGTFMDLVIRFRPGKKRFLWTRAHTALRYSLLGLTLLVLASGSLVLIDLLDPFSLFGRLMTTLFRPLAATLNNALVRVFESLGSYSLVTVEFPWANLPVLMVCLACLGLIVGLAMKKGRLYCNSLCPVGAFLGLVSRLSLFRVSIDRTSCVSCGKCERVCKAGCIDSKNYQVDISRCVACYTCLPVCPENCINLTMTGMPKREMNPNRRTLLLLVGLAVAGFPKKLFAQIAKPLVYVKNTISIMRRYPTTPPGSRSIAEFTSACTGCYLCVSHCPGKVIQPALTPYGSKGFLMPRMDNSRGFCNFTCTTCGAICPTGAILPLTLDAKQQIQIGTVNFIRENCIVITQKTECGACSEHCPTKAVAMVLENGLRVPKVNPKICVGCGACEYACPSIPYKSIYVEGNPIHITAEKPKTEEIEKPMSGDDFPF